jgi:hypothetical protein
MNNGHVITPVVSRLCRVWFSESDGEISNKENKGPIYIMFREIKIVLYYFMI